MISENSLEELYFRTLKNPFADASNNSSTFELGKKLGWEQASKEAFSFFECQYSSSLFSKNKEINSLRASLKVSRIIAAAAALATLTCIILYLL